MFLPNDPTALSRRSFLKNTTTTAAGLTVLGALGGVRSVHASNDDTIKLALVGCGNRGSGACQQALMTGNVKLVAMADVFQKRINASLAALSGQRVDDPEAAKPVKLESKGHTAAKLDVPKERQFVGIDAYKKAIAAADVVIIAGPPGFRAVHFEEAVNQGKHVFMEKPLGTDARCIHRILAANKIAKDKNLKVGVGFQRHHEGVYKDLIKRIKDGDIGDVLAMRVYWRGGSRGGVERLPGENELAYQLRNWYFYTYLSGDHIVEQHCHQLDVAYWIKGTHPVRCQGIGGRQARTANINGQIYDHHFVEFEYDDGSRLFSECSQIPRTWGDVSEHVIGSNGFADLQGANRSQIRGPKAYRYKGHDRNPYEQEHIDLFDAIRNNKTYNEVESSAYATMTAIMGRMATYSGEKIEWDDAFNSKLVLMPDINSMDQQPPVMPNPDGSYPVVYPGHGVAI